MNESLKTHSATSSGTFSQSFMLRMNTEQRNKVLKHQTKHLTEWKKLEIKYLNKYLIIHSFCHQPLEKCKEALFTIEGDYDVRCFISSAWSYLPQEVHPKGLELSNLIIKPKVGLRIKSLAFSAKMRVRLVGDSELFIFSRTEGSIEKNSPVVKISKDTSLNGTFVLFGNVCPENGKVVFMKQVQVPEELGLLTEKVDYRKLDIDFCDNGDSRIFIKVESYGKTEVIKQFNTVCDTFVPFFGKSRLLIGGSGQGVKLKTLSVQQRERVLIQNEKEKECKCVVV